MRKSTPYRGTQYVGIFLLLLSLTQPLFGASGTISASPNPCSIASGQSVCTSTLTWSSQSASVVQVWLSFDGAAETNFATTGGGGPYSQAATWIQAGHSYSFRLYDYSTGSRGAMLASVGVSGTVAPPPATGTISAQPPDQCSILVGQTTCSVTLTWSSQSTNQVQVFVSVNAAPETNFATTGGGGPYSQAATWILAGRVYNFRLYNYNGGVRGSMLSQLNYVGIPCTFE